MNQEMFLILLNEYLKNIKNIVSEFQREFAVVDIIDARRGGLIPVSGRLLNIHGSEYQFHGLGCSVRIGSTVYDFDFVDLPGFNPWKFKNHLISRGEVQDENGGRLFDELINELIATGRLKKERNSLGDETLVV